MADLQSRYDGAMFDFAQEQYPSAIAQLRSLLQDAPGYFEAQLALGMAYYRLGDYAAALVEGHKAEKLRPNEQLVHTNLSLFYMKSGDKKTAEHHGLQARIASWKEPGSAVNNPGGESDLKMAPPPAAPVRAAQEFPDMPWKKKGMPGQSSNE